MKELIKEARRMQQIAGLLKESQLVQNEGDGDASQILNDFSMNIHNTFNRLKAAKGGTNIPSEAAINYLKKTFQRAIGDISGVEGDMMGEGGVMNEDESFNAMVKNMEDILVTYIENAKGDPSVSLGGQLSSEEREFVIKLGNLIKQAKQDDKYTQSPL